VELHRFGELKARVVGSGEELIVVLLHGFGAPGDDLVSLAHAIRAPQGTRFIFPEAPISFTLGFGESRAWWMIDIEHIQTMLMEGRLDELRREVPQGLDAVRAKLDLLLDAVQAKYQVSGTRVVLGGFSQGAMLALDLALHGDRSLAGLILFSGTIMCVERWRKRMPLRKDIPILQSHGTVDPVLPYVFADELKGMLVAAGFDHTWKPFMGGHEIPPLVMAAAGEFLARVKA
jgi:phospholipase/carboxylesterase